ncbi:MAG TPA: hypothetical protein VIM34_21680 [Burkholderiaceae bacterium]
MDREVVEQKSESLRRRLRRIEAKCPADAQALVTDTDHGAQERGMNTISAKRGST